MTTIPTVPSFASNDSSITNLQQLASAVDFLVSCDVRPMFHYYKTTSFTLAAGWNSPLYTLIAADSDGIYSSGGAVIVTQGHYSFEGCQGVNNPANVLTDCAFLFTAGANNIHFSPGATYRFGQRAGESTGNTSVDNVFSICGIPHTCLYPGDRIDFQAYVASGTPTTSYNSNGSYIEGRYVPSFSGMWLRTGT